MPYAPGESLPEESRQQQIISQIADSANRGRFSYDEWQRKHFDNIVSVLEKEQRISSRQVVEELS